jgi:hypothetical protein
VTSKLEPVMRGGAGGADRTSTVTAGPACAHQRVTRFTFAVRWPSGSKSQGKRAAAVAEHLITSGVTRPQRLATACVAAFGVGLHEAACDALQEGMSGDGCG